VLDSHLIVAVEAAVRGAQPEALHAVLEVDDLFGSSIREVPELRLEPERPKNAVVESQRSLDIRQSGQRVRPVSMEWLKFDGDWPVGHPALQSALL
jgi:hypothetical protein